MPRQAVSAATAVIAAARSHGERPIFDPARSQPAPSIVSVGSTVPEQRELDERVLERAALIIADEPTELLAAERRLHRGGHGRHRARRQDALARGAIQETLPPIDHGAINVFKSVGSALQDVAVARSVLSRANAAGQLSHLLEITLTSKETAWLST